VFKYVRGKIILWAQPEDKNFDDFFPPQIWPHSDNCRSFIVLTYDNNGWNLFSNTQVPLMITRHLYLKGKQWSSAFKHRFSTKILSCFAEKLYPHAVLPGRKFFFPALDYTSKCCITQAKIFYRNNPSFIAGNLVFTFRLSTQFSTLDSRKLSWVLLVMTVQ
jgi:hypothetical protein